MKKIIFLLLSITYVLCSCGNFSNKEVVSDKDNNNHNLVEYAENFEIYAYQSGHKVVIKGVSKAENFEFYLFNDSIDIPKELDGKTVIKTPIKSAITFSSTQWAVFQKLDEMGIVKGVLESNYSKNEEILRLVSEGKIIDVGTSTHVNTEKVIGLQAELILYTPYPTIDYSHLGELSGSTMIPFPDYLESHPLGRAEWMKVIGLLCSRENETEAWFDKVVRRYETLSELCSQIEDKPSVFSDLPFENQWYAPGGKSYIAKIFHDAGADYIWKDNESTGSIQLDAESVLLKAQQADYWRVINSYDTPFSYEQLEKENELFAHFKSFKEKKLLVCDAKESGYFEHSQYEPEILLADFIYHFHPELLKNEWENHSPKYFKRLLSNE